ncbi:MAG: hypothetical protein IT578_03730 [Verrucomicrobiae bacterium]|nr:hypothetical protein [Verrucomicrobiae bacterium]
MKRDGILQDLPAHIGRAVAHYWTTRFGQKDRQKEAGQTDQGLRGAVTGGAQMDGFSDLFAEIIVAAGIPGACVYRRRDVELPGFFRPTKEWDLLVVRDRVCNVFCVNG